MASPLKKQHTSEYKAERKIMLKVVMSLPVFTVRPSYYKVLRWSRHGCYGIWLESHREGNAIMTSREAVVRFLEELNQG